VLTVQHASMSVIRRNGGLLLSPCLVCDLLCWYKAETLGCSALSSVLSVLCASLVAWLVFCH
jgi:hypothetical protein